MRRGARVLACALVLGTVAHASAQTDAPPPPPPPDAAPSEPAPAQDAPPPAATPLPAGPRDLAYTHAEVGAFGTVDLTAISAHPMFGDLIAHTLARYGVGPVASAAVVRMLQHTRTMSGTLTYGPGDSAVIASLLLRGDYGPTEVPDAFHDVLPSLARGLWHPTRIDGRRAFDLGVAALVEVEPGAWLISRRIDGNLALGGRDHVPSALREAAIEAGSLLTPHTAFGALVGPRATIPGNEPPQTIEDLFRGPSRATAALRFEGGRAIVEIYATLHHRSDAARWSDAYRGWLGSLATDLGVPESTIVTRVELAGVVLHGHVEMEPVAVDAFVARLVGGRLLTTPPAAPAPPN